MILLKDIQGQDNAVRYLVNSLRSGRISDSYLFSGPRGVGRVLTAKAFIMDLVCEKGPLDSACGICSCCRRIDKLEHPDLLYLKPEKNKSVKVDEIRQVKDKLNLKPYESGAGICLIEDAHMMTVEAANALLKLLEEPPGESILILVSDKKDNLLPTVISRCAEVRFRALPVDIARSIIAGFEGVSPGEAFSLACLSQGSPGTALEMIEAGVLLRRESSMEKLDEVLSSPELSCASWDSEKKDDLIEAADMLVMMLRDIVISREGSTGKIFSQDIGASRLYGFFERYSVEHICKVMEKLISLKRALLGSVNPKLVAQILPGCLEEFSF